MQPTPTLNFKLSDGRDLSSLGWVTKEYLISVFPGLSDQIYSPQIWVWGNNTNAELGIFTDANSKSTPVTTFFGGSTWKQISAGYRHSLAVRSDGSLLAWGYNGFGQLGNSSTITASTPVFSNSGIGGTLWKQVSAGYLHSAGIQIDGRLWCWGNSAYGQLAGGLPFVAVGRRSSPNIVNTGSPRWKYVNAGGNSTAAIGTDGSLWMWGQNDVGQCGNNLKLVGNGHNSPVTTFAGGFNWKQVSCSTSITAAIKTDGTLWIWGYNLTGGLGTNTSGEPRCTPVTTFAGGNNWKQVSTNGTLTAAIKNDGTLWLWGDGDMATGQGSISRSTPVTTIYGGTTWKQVFVAPRVLSAGNQFTAAIRTDGTLWVWGLNTNGALGINNVTTRCTPVTTFAGGGNWLQAEGGKHGMVALKAADLT
jgi:alpha-tubulin suppressor-like RCC1 family protein